MCRFPRNKLSDLKQNVYSGNASNVSTETSLPGVSIKNKSFVSGIEQAFPSGRRIPLYDTWFRLQYRPSQRAAPWGFGHVT